MMNFHSSLALRMFTALAAMFAVTPDASAAQFLFGTSSDGQSLSSNAIRSGGASPVDREVADDFTASGVLQRVIVNGWDCFYCPGALSSGVNVRIYERATGGTPGALLHEFHLAADDPRFIHDPNRSGHESVLDITFPQGFAVDGSYFLSVQLEYPGPATWPLWSAATNSPHGSAYYVRDRLAGSGWLHDPNPVGGFRNSDVSFSLYGVRPGPPPPRLVAGCGEWSVQQAPLPEGAVDAQLEAVKAFGPNDIWAVGDYSRVVQGSTLSYSLAMHYRNGAWAIVPTPSPTECAVCTQVLLTAIDGLASNDIWAAGWKRAQTLDGFLGGQVFVIHYDGTNWTEVPAPRTRGGSGAWVRGIKVLAPDDIWFVGDWVGETPWNGPSTPALAMHWNGSSFTLIQTPYPAGGTPGWSFDAVSGTDNDLWAVGGGSDGDPAGTTYFAHWNGSQWQLSQPQMPGLWKRFSHLLSLAPNRIYAGGEGFTVAAGYFGIVAQYDGSAWSMADTDGDGGGAMVSFGPDSVLALGGAPVYWNGTAWAPQPTVPDVFGALLDIEQTGPCNATAVGMQWVADVKRPLIARIKPIVFDSSFE